MSQRLNGSQGGINLANVSYGDLGNELIKGEPE